MCGLVGCGPGPEGLAIERTLAPDRDIPRAPGAFTVIEITAFRFGRVARPLGLRELNEPGPKVVSARSGRVSGEPRQSC
jgi:hypothetical protein